jgi:hypothetical protein
VTKLSGYRGFKSNSEDLVSIVRAGSAFRRRSRCRGIHYLKIQALRNFNF